MSLTVFVAHKIGTLATISARGARNRSIGATKSFNSAVNEAEALVFTTNLLNGVPQTSEPKTVTGSKPSLVRFTENSMNWLAIYLVATVLFCRTTLKAPGHSLFPHC